MKNLDKSGWIEEVLNSTRGMARAHSGQDMLTKIASAQNAGPKTIVIYPPARQWVAAAIVLLALNLSSVLYFTAGKSKSVPANEGGGIATEIPSVSTYNY
jgi:hypothetical protein